MHIFVGLVNTFCSVHLKSSFQILAVLCLALNKLFVELGGGVDEVPPRCHFGVCVELGFR